MATSRAGGVVQLQQQFPVIAVGKINLVDSSVSGAAADTVILNRMSLPRVSDVVPASPDAPALFGTTGLALDIAQSPSPPHSHSPSGWRAPGFSFSRQLPRLPSWHSCCGFLHLQCIGMPVLIVEDDSFMLASLCSLAACSFFSSRKILRSLAAIHPHRLRLCESLVAASIRWSLAILRPAQHLRRHCVKLWIREPAALCGTVCSSKAFGKLCPLRAALLDNRQHDVVHHDLRRCLGQTLLVIASSVDGS